MKFGPVALDAAIGGILAHREAGLKKGTVLTAADVETLKAAGLTSVVVAHLEPTDVGEDAAAMQLAEALITGAEGVRLNAASAGRVNVIADAPGLAAISAGMIQAANRIDPMITIATVPELYRMDAGGLIATIKVISYGVAKARVEETCRVAQAAIGLHLPRPQTVALIETFHDRADGLSDKGERALRERLSRLGLDLGAVAKTKHGVDDLSRALAAETADVICLLTASATSDIADVGPMAVAQAGGSVAHFGMPVDPGNLLFLGWLGERPVIGLPGCARSPALNGADWVLERLLCGVSVTPDDIMGMGVGGLLKEIPSRPRPRRQGSE